VSRFWPDTESEHGRDEEAGLSTGHRKGEFSGWRLASTICWFIQGDRMLTLKQGSTKPSDRVLWILAGLLAVSVVSFGAFYYYDRYVHPDETIMDRQAQHLEKMVQQNPQNPDLRVGVAEYYLQQGMINEAIEQGAEALKIEPEHQAALILLGRAYARKGEAETAIGHFNHVIELNKDNPMADADVRLEAVYYQLGNLYNAQGQHADALEALKHALVIDGTDADALYALGTTYQVLGEHDNAIDAFEEALRFGPDFPEAYQGLETNYAALGKTQEAAYAQAMFLFTKQRYNDAATQLEAIVAESPDLMQAYLGLGLVYEKLGRSEEAKVALKRFLEANPNDIAAMQALGRLSQGAYQQ